MGTKKQKRKKERRRRRDSGRERPELAPPTIEHDDESVRRLLTPEEFRQLSDEFFSGVPERLQALKDEVVEAMAPFDAFDVLANLLIANRFWG